MTQKMTYVNLVLVKINTLGGNMIVQCLIIVYYMQGNIIKDTGEQVRGVYIKANTGGTDWLVNFQTDLKKKKYALSLNNGTQWVNSNNCLKVVENE